MKSKSDDPLAQWPEFMEMVRHRMEAGKKAYGDDSFLRPPKELAGEIEEELADVCGWSFILWVRMQDIKRRLPE